MWYNKKAWEEAFYKTWEKLKDDEVLHSFYDNDRQAFINDFTLVARMDENGNIYKVDDGGNHLNIVFHHQYWRIAKNLHPDPPGRNLFQDEIDQVFSSLENRPTKAEDLKQSVIKEEVKYKEEMKNLNRNQQLYGYLYYHLYKGMVEIILDLKKEVKEEILYKHIRDAKLSIRQSCLTLYFLKVPIISQKDAVSSCGYSPNSVKDFRDFYTSIKINETVISDHGRDTEKNLSRVLDFLEANDYDVSQANLFYSNFKSRVQS